MIFRDDRLACEARIRVLETELRTLRRESQSRMTASLRRRLHNEHRSLIWARRRLTQRVGWMLPRSMSELLVALGVAMICLTLAGGFAFLVAIVASIKLA